MTQLPLPVRQAAPLRRPVRPGARPNLKLPGAKPAALARSARGYRSTATSSQIAAASNRQLLTWLRIGVVVVLTLLTLLVAVTQLASWGVPDPTVEYVPGDSRWAHVEDLP